MIILSVEELIAWISKPQADMSNVYIPGRYINRLPRLRRFKPRTVRGWLERGKFKNAIRNDRGEWLVPLPDVLTFQPPKPGRPGLNTLLHFLPYLLYDLITPGGLF